MLVVFLCGAAGSRGSDH